MSERGPYWRSYQFRVSPRFTASFRVLELMLVYAQTEQDAQQVNVRLVRLDNRMDELPPVPLCGSYIHCAGDGCTECERVSHQNQLLEWALR